MKLTVILAACAAMANAGLILIPITPSQIVEKINGDCFFGVVTPEGCGYVVVLIKYSLVLI